MSYVRELIEEVWPTHRTISDSARELAKMTVASSVAASSLGVTEPPFVLVEKRVRRSGGAGEASLWFSQGVSLPMAVAARLNHMAADQSMADDSALVNGAHLGSAVTAAALAVAEMHDSSGGDLLQAIVVGYEVGVRLAYAEGSLRKQRGTHVSGLNAFACAATAASLLHSSPETVMHALAFAATTAGGVDRVSTTNARAYQAGLSAGLGVEAALLADDGYRADESILDRYLEIIGFDGRPTDRDVPSRAFGAGSALIEQELMIKLRPGPFLYASAVEAALRLADTHDVGAEAIDRLDVYGTAFLEEGPSRRPPPAGSLTYCIASAIVRGGMRWDHFAQTPNDGAVVADLRERVHIHRAGKAQAPGDWPWAARVVLSTRSGAEHAIVVDAPPGSAKAGLEWNAVEDKVHALIGLGGASPSAILQKVHGLDKVDNVLPLVAELR